VRLRIAIDYARNQLHSTETQRQHRLLPGSPGTSRLRRNACVATRPAPPDDGGRGATLRKRNVIRRLIPFQNRVLNPAIGAGIAAPTYAIPETTGRRSGGPRQVPVANGLDGDRFWLIAALGGHAAYIRNIKANPHVRVEARPPPPRVGLRMRWRRGTRNLVPVDDARARQRELGRRRPRLSGRRAAPARARNGAVDGLIELDDAASKTAHAR
jgi:deazaflavin-dependent oxidoreductase (nitroreductase family)